MSAPVGLARYQEALLALLDSGASVAEIRVALGTAPEFAAYRDYTAQIDDHMLEAAIDLMKRWGRRADPSQ